jgi:hypothetical protein
MANQDAAFGLKPIGKVGQNRDNQGLSEYSIAATATAIYQNDPVQAAATGTIAVANNSTAVLLGSLNGVFYTDSSTQKPTWANHLEAANAATDIVGFVSDDPYERFEIQSNGTNAITQASVFFNYNISYTAGSASNYQSKVELDESTGVATTAQLRLLGFSKDPDNNDISSANVNMVVMINEHFLKSTTGI